MKQKKSVQECLKKKNLSDKTHRCTSPRGKLVLFHP
ncbi:YhzD family protein [Mesobacillus subterraneus]